ncbi:hypothetical protein FBU30_010099 [Linnemannia zychae]|nr:hypothetical protein FBU30_010099 [Linnemannia zychae]
MPIPQQQPTQRRTALNAQSSNSTSSALPISSVADESIWYLAYGSNMNPETFTKSRGIQPLETQRVCVPGYWLSFDLGGIPFSEPCFASILKMDKTRLKEKAYAQFVHDRCRFGQVFVWDGNTSNDDWQEKSYPPELQGVVYRITERDWKLIVESEGGWGHDVSIGYDTIHVECRAYSTHETLTARVLLARPSSLKSCCQPSMRYKSLITTGAQFHDLDAKYQHSLARVNWGKDNRDAEGRKIVVEYRQPPYWMAWMFDKAYRFASWAHDWILMPVVGVSGRCLGDKEMQAMRLRVAMALQEQDI